MTTTAAASSRRTTKTNTPLSRVTASNMAADSTHLKMQALLLSPHHRPLIIHISSQEATRYPTSSTVVNLRTAKAINITNSTPRIKAVTMHISSRSISKANNRLVTMEATAAAVTPMEHTPINNRILVILLARGNSSPDKKASADLVRVCSAERVVPLWDTRWAEVSWASWVVSLQEL